MPKINVYLPDDLAETVRALDVPVSAICQRALEQSVRRVAAIRAADPADLSGLERVTDRFRGALALAAARATGEVGTSDLLHGLLTEGDNLAARVLPTLDVDVAALRRAVPERPDASGGRTWSAEAASALELSVVEALALGHNYVGCEHLLLGLVAEPDGGGGRALRAAGADVRSVRRAVTAALSGYEQLRANSPAPDQGAALAAVTGLVRRELAPLVERISRLEQRG
ncbi:MULTISPECIES: Clp protease N-terminal domain-containing protein [Actinosynnema]|uniref:Clp protease N-terminal domain-containing protein n=1 Tax=Actinosynnema TaxID=40566 RepID=UPI0020A50984|nr:Clp protease N-terminal domain-containing protein [Actinosynnema pretiosum]MCP2099025.1 Clp amino terminal domain-containing protein, pathogenicity island component [Actinosynnema pretiosum]